MLEAVLYPSKYKPDVFTGTAFFGGGRKYKMVAKSHGEKWVLFFEIKDKLKKCGVAFLFPKPEKVRGKKLYDQLGVVKLNGIDWTYLLVRDPDTGKILII